MLTDPKALMSLKKNVLVQRVIALEQQLIQAQAAQLPLQMPSDGLTYKVAAAMARDLAKKTGKSHMPVRTTDGSYTVQSA